MICSTDSYDFIVGMVSCLDEAVKNVTEALKRKGLYDDSVIVFSTGELYIDKYKHVSGRHVYIYKYKETLCIRVV